MFEIPIKMLVVNSDSQVQLLESDGTAYTDGDVTAVTDGFILQKWLTKDTLVSDLVGGTITKRARVASAIGVTTYTVVSTSTDVNDSFTIEVNSIDGTPVGLGQQRRVFKRYQLKDVGALDSAAEIATSIRAAINADKDASVVASGATVDVILTAKDVGVTPNLYADDFTGTTAYTTPATNGSGNYENLINEEWGVNTSPYENQEQLPVKGKIYNQYDFTVTGTAYISGYGGQFPNQVNASGNYNFRLYVETTTTLDTALTDLIGDIAAIV